MLYCFLFSYFQLDAKKSPLALLAQTCSSIGKDTTPAKSIIPPIEKKDVRKDDRKSLSPKTKLAEVRPSSVKRERLSPGRERSPGFKTPTLKESPLPANSRSPDPLDLKTSPSPHNERDTTSVSSANDNGPTKDSKNSDLRDSTASVSSSSASRSSGTAVPASFGSISSLASSKEAALYAGAYPPSFGGLPGCGAAGLPGMLGHHPYSFDPALAALHAAAKHHGGPLGSAAASPYSYTRVKTATGATTLVPVCRDPYCTNCQLSMQGAFPQHPVGAPCPTGCTQCTSDKSPAVSSASLPPTSLSSPLSGLPASLALPGTLPTSAASSLPLPSSLYSHPFGIVPGQNHLLFVCNWVHSGSDYCGKRFATSEELLHHLRTHTSSSDMASLAAGLSAYHGLGLGAAAASSAAAAAALSCHPYPPPNPGSMSPNSALRHAYSGRSMSPNSLLAASRYHPYKSPLAGLPSVPSSLPTLPNPLAPYYSPYAALYAPRLGAAVAP